MGSNSARWPQIYGFQAKQIGNESRTACQIILKRKEMATVRPTFFSGGGGGGGGGPLPGFKQFPTN